MDEKVKELSLLLLHLTCWEEESRNNPGEKVFRAWKGYLFEVLNELEKENCILQFRHTKSVIVTEEGKQRAEKLKRKYCAAARA